MAGIRAGVRMGTDHAFEGRLPERLSTGAMRSTPRSSGDIERPTEGSHATSDPQAGGFRPHGASTPPRPSRWMAAPCARPALPRRPPPFATTDCRRPTTQESRRGPRYEEPFSFPTPQQRKLCYPTTSSYGNPDIRGAFYPDPPSPPPAQAGMKLTQSGQPGR